MKTTLVLCVLALVVALVYGSGGHGHVSFNDSPHCRPPPDHHGGHGGGHGGGHHDEGHGGGHGDDGHGDSHDTHAADSHGAADSHDTGHGAAGHGDAHAAANPLHMCSTLFSFIVLSAVSKVW